MVRWGWPKGRRGRTRGAARPLLHTCARDNLHTGRHTGVLCGRTRSARAVRWAPRATRTLPCRAGWLSSRPRACEVVRVAAPAARTAPPPPTLRRTAPLQAPLLATAPRCPSPRRRPCGKERFEVRCVRGRGGLCRCARRAAQQQTSHACPNLQNSRARGCCTPPRAYHWGCASRERTISMHRLHLSVCEHLGREVAARWAPRGGRTKAQNTGSLPATPRAAVRAPGRCLAIAAWSPMLKYAGAKSALALGPLRGLRLDWRTCPDAALLLASSRCGSVRSQVTASGPTGARSARKASLV